jgi:hypothetical protein
MRMRWVRMESGNSAFPFLLASDGAADSLRIAISEIFRGVLGVRGRRADCTAFAVTVGPWTCLSKTRKPSETILASRRAAC